MQDVILLMGVLLAAVVVGMAAIFALTPKKGR